MKILTQKEVSKILGVSMRTLREWKKNGKLIPHYENNKPLYYEEDINKYLNKSSKSSFDMLLKVISKEEILHLYLDKNYSKKKCEDILNISDTNFSKLLKFYNIQKTKEQISESAKHTNIEKYGEDYAKKRCVVSMETKTKKYGDPTYNNNNKSKQTCLARYGVDNPNKLESVRNKIKNTNLNKYGVSVSCNQKNMIEHNKQVKIERYGSVNNHKKAVETNLQKYGVKAPLQNAEIFNKKTATCINKYGAPNTFASDEIKDKIQQTCLERYGVPYYCMTEKCRNSSVNNNSSCNLEFEKLLKKNNISFTREFSLEKYNYDFKVDTYLIEINPSSTHNSLWGWKGHGKPLEKDYHYKKSLIAKKYGFRCIHIFDWDDLQKIIDMIKPKSNVIYAKKCVVKKISERDANDFLIINHLQGKCLGNILNYGLFYNDQLIEVMTFGKPRYNKKYDYELLRLCSKSGYIVVGGTEKLYASFKKDNADMSVISYCDSAKFSGEIYKKLGFKLQTPGSPGLHWIHPYTKKHITDNLLRQRGFDQLFNTTFGKGTSNTQLMIEHGFVPVYDCGQQTWIDK